MLVIIVGDEKGKCEFSPYVPKCHIFKTPFYEFALTNEEQ